jgi:two-component system KDP operon response regulator KdpE
MDVDSPKILVVDNEPTIRKSLRIGLRAQGYEICDVSTGKEGLERLEAEKLDLVLTDIVLPDISGPEFLRMMRGQDDVAPIIVLSSKGDEAVKVKALVLGADDYGTKPFGMKELLARMRAALRHQIHVSGERPIFRTGNLSVDLVRRVVRLGERDVKLSPKEYDLLRLLVQHADKILTHRFLLNALWDNFADAQYLRVCVRQLRQKIEDDVQQHRYILTEIGIGYRMRAPD